MTGNSPKTVSERSKSNTTASLMWTKKNTLTNRHSDRAQIAEVLSGRLQSFQKDA